MKKPEITLFTDINGVLLPYKDKQLTQFEAYGASKRKELIKHFKVDVYHHFINYLIDMGYKVNIVISSNFRLVMHPINPCHYIPANGKQLQQLFQQHDFSKYIVGSTPYIPPTTIDDTGDVRGEEINKYLRECSVSNPYVVLDDQRIFGHSEYFVRCNTNSGFSHSRVFTALKCLDKQFVQHDRNHRSLYNGFYSWLKQHVRPTAQRAIFASVYNARAQQGLTPFKSAPSAPTQDISEINAKLIKHQQASPCDFVDKREQKAVLKALMNTEKDQDTNTAWLREPICPV